VKNTENANYALHFRCFLIVFVFFGGGNPPPDSRAAGKLQLGEANHNARIASS